MKTFEEHKKKGAADGIKRWNPVLHFAPSLSQPKVFRAAQITFCRKEF